MKTKQITATIPVDLAEKVKEYAEKNRRSFSESVALLLEVGVKEKSRPRKALAS